MKLEGYEIYLSADFYDIYNFCFPFSLHSRVNSNWDNEDYIKYYYNYQISRCTMFFMLSLIYKKPNILLPPYVDECDTFIEYLNVQVDRYIFEGLKNHQDNPNLELNDLIKDCKSTGDYDKLINYINSNYSQLIYYYSRGYASSLEMFNKLLSKFFTDDLNILLGNKVEVDKDLYFITEKYAAKRIDKKRIKNLVHDARRTKGRYFQNERDANAIYTALSLNEIYNIYKKAFCLFSSANNLKQLMSQPISYVNTMSISGKEFKVLRDPRFFLDIMFEINNYFNYNLNKVRIEKIDLEDLRLSITKTLSKLNFYNSYMFGSGGILTEIIQNEAKKFINLDNNIDKMEDNLSILLDEYINIEDDFARYKGIDKEIAQSIIRAYDKEPLSYALFMRRLEMEKDNLQKVIISLKKSEKRNLYIAIFSLPFRLNLGNDIAIDIIRNIVSSSFQGRVEIAAKRYISDKTCEKIYTRLNDLINLSEEIIDENERLLAWQFCFLYIGRYDLVDHIYDLFNKYVSDSLKREMTYIYIVSFIRKFRAIEISDADYFLNMLKLCDKYIYSSYIFTGNINSYEIEICKDKCFLKDNVSGNILVSNLINIEQGMAFNLVDIRFFHLKSTIINRFMLDFGMIDQKQIQDMITEYESVFIPIVYLFENDYKIAVLSSYAYLLSLFTETIDYKENIEKALSIIIKLRAFVDKDMNNREPFWGYVRNFQSGYIHYKYSFKCENEDKLYFIQKAKYFYELSSRELPILAENLQKLIYSKIALCDIQIKVLNEAKGL